jgi:hypothetical protein
LPFAKRHLPKKESHPACAKKPRMFVDEIDPCLKIGRRLAYVRQCTPQNRSKIPKMFQHCKTLQKIFSKD